MSVGKELCYVSAAWKGRAPSAVRVSQPSLQDDVHRIKVDEGAGIVITSFNMGGISVCDLESGSLLWALSAVRYNRSTLTCVLMNSRIMFLDTPMWNTRMGS